MPSNKHPREIERLHELVDRAAALLRVGRQGVVCVSASLRGAPDPLSWVAAAQDEVRAYWSVRDHTIAGVGAAVRISASGPDRFVDAERAWREIVTRATTAGSASVRPLAIGGFSFDPRSRWRGFPALCFVVPRVTLESRRGTTLVTLTIARGAGAVRELRAARRDLARLVDAVPLESRPARIIGGRSVPIDSTWLRAVARTAADVRARRISKVVLARARLLVAGEPIDPGTVVARLRDANRGARVFWIGTPSGSFVGASPEWLARLRGRCVRTAALAGSLVPGLPGALLLDSVKDRIEHALVVKDITGRLRPMCDRVVAASRPVVVPIGYIQHLTTPIAGHLRARTGLFGVTARLHPTAAIAGAPRQKALAVIRRREPLARGWYGGGVGWMDSSGDGDIAVAIRSALLRGRRARVFAGAGIVAMSRQEAELSETETKLKPMLRALGVGE